MSAIEFGEYLRRLRKNRKLTIRQLDTYSGVSNSYISQMERGERGVPSPEILQKLAKPLGIKYEELMKKAGYIEETKNNKESAYALPESEIERVIKETEEHYKVNLHDDPVVLAAMRQLIQMLAEAKAKEK